MVTIRVWYAFVGAIASGLAYTAGVILRSLAE